MMFTFGLKVYKADLLRAVLEPRVQRALEGG